MPTPEQIEAMGRFNEQMIEAGILLAGEGLHPSIKGARIRKEGGRYLVMDGPFSESKELIGGFWLIQVKDRDEAVAWCLRIPLEDGEEVELRQVFEVSDLPPDLANADRVTQRPVGV